jgi:hypothetical protein
MMATTTTTVTTADDVVVGDEVAVQPDTNTFGDASGAHAIESSRPPNLWAWATLCFCLVVVCATAVLITAMATGVITHENTLPAKERTQNVGPR